MNNMTSALAQQNISVIAFRLDHRTFALPLDVIVQILPMMTITPIPHLNGIVKGTINVRGESVLVVSLRNHFGILEEPLQLYTPLLLLKVHNRLVALIVDEVLDVMTLSLEKVASLQAILPDGIENIPMLSGISYHDNETVLVLNPDHLFYNQQPLAQALTQPLPKTFNQPVVELLDQIPAQSIVETETGAEGNAPVVKKKPSAKRMPVAKTPPAEDSAPDPAVSPEQNEQS